MYLENGDSFGEHCLLYNAKRNATIICEEDTHFALLNRKQFDYILSIIF